MNIDICPTITRNTPEEYEAQMERVAKFVRRIHIDLSDGGLAPNQLLPVDQVWWPGGISADLHVMYRQPHKYLATLIALGPQLVILHAEAEGNFLECANLLHRHGIEAGIALLPQTPVANIKPGLDFIDHVLIFSGNLGHQGGSHADLNLLAKVKELKSLKPTLEIGWDGGVNDENIKQLVNAGVEVVNAGGFIQKAPSAEAAYATLEQRANG
jgi:ribulose-phosphate 3-epimerase